jgi:HD-GYP domain-containing protein (c-di-GMP phosphodiesterase class II)/HAMP domain-containing protein
MKTRTPKKRFPLHIHIASLFIILILIVGVTLAWIGYRQISNLAFDNTEVLFGKTADELLLQFQKDYRPVATSVRLLANAALSDANDLEERMRYVPLLAEIIKDEPQISAFHVGYATGDFFIMLPLRNDYIRAMFSAPAEAFYVVNHINHNDNGENRQTRIFLAEQLEPVGDAIASTTDFDPRLRPWYQDAETSATIQVTSPYMFLSLQQIGVTISKYSPRGKSTVSADVTLESLADTLRNNQVTPSTFSLIYNSDGEVLAHNTHGIDSPLAHIRENQVPKIDDLPDSLVEVTHQLTANPGQVFPFVHNDERWFGSVRELAVHSRLQIRFLIAAPERELLVAAFSARRTSIIITVLVILLALPIAWFIANQVARPMRILAREAQDIAGFDFDENISVDSIILEVEQLSTSMDTMRITIGNFFSLITSLSGESDIDRLLDRVTDETMRASSADAAVIYLLTDDETELHAQPPRLANGAVLTDNGLPDLMLDGSSSNRLLDSFKRKEVVVEQLGKDHVGGQPLQPLVEALGAGNPTIIVLPLTNRDNAGSGLLCLLYSEQNRNLKAALSPEHIGFTEALSGFAAVSMESRQLLKMQKNLLQSFIELIASAIDAKSPYTGGHCQRVPELTKMLATAACDSQDPRFKEFSLSDEEWEELHIAAWLHDCGKVTTPEYVVDKSTKLETIYDRIHEIRMRFEVLKRDAEIDYWQRVSAGGNEAQLKAELEAKLNQLDDDFAFVAKCNEGGEFMADEKIARLNQIAATTWRRTLSDRIGVSWEEGLRQQRVPETELPTEEPLIADKEEHVIYRDADEVIPEDNPWSFKLDTPQHRYNRGELYNLSVARGTLANEERFKINDHMVQTIIMLNQLPFPRHLRNVPAIAGGHHETMIGTGYPKKLRREDMSLTARMMAIADIFEALTAADRPYKKAKTLSESIKIMNFMKKDQHIDPDLFDLFLQSGVYLDYAKQFLAESQIDEVDISEYLGSLPGN